MRLCRTEQAENTKSTESYLSYLSSPLFLQCYKLQSDSFKIVSDLCLIKAVDTHYHHDWSVLFFFQKNKCSP